ncbi:MAG: hypothetical protein R3Y67_08845 [Eubacteriales bacterium]
MSSKTKIIVLHQKEVLYTSIFTLLGILFLLLLFLMFLPSKESMELQQDTTNYVPGIYTTSLAFQNYSLDVEVVLTDTTIESIRLVNLDEVVTTMYPLIEPSFDSLINQIYTKQSIEGITYSQDNKYTTLLLLDAIETSLDKALVSSSY